MEKFNNEIITKMLEAAKEKKAAEDAAKKEKAEQFMAKFKERLAEYRASKEEE